MGGGPAMAGTMAWGGMDVHARSTQAAAIDVWPGELTRVRFGPGVEGPIAWLAGLPGPVRGCYEAGPTGFGLHGAAAAAGLEVVVVAPGQDAAWSGRSGQDRPQGRRAVGAAAL